MGTCWDRETKCESTGLWQGSTQAWDMTTKSKDIARSIGNSFKPLSYEPLWENDWIQPETSEEILKPIQEVLKKKFTNLKVTKMEL